LCHTLQSLTLAAPFSETEKESRVKGRGGSWNLEVWVTYVLCLKKLASWLWGSLAGGIEVLTLLSHSGCQYQKVQWCYRESLHLQLFVFQEMHWGHGLLFWCNWMGTWLRGRLLDS
jgi:hypothetical protein